MDQELIETLVDAASWGGMPPQFLKAQAAQETSVPKRHDPRNYRYEPITIDFNALSGPSPGTASHRAKTLYKKHLYDGNAINPTRGAGEFRVCAAASGNCGLATSPDLRVAPGATTFTIAAQGSSRTLIYHDTVTAHPTFQTPILTRQDPPTAAFVNGVLVETIPVVTAGQFAFDPTDNAITLGVPLAQNQGVLFSFETVQTTPLITDPAGCAVDPGAPLATSFDGFANPARLGFLVGDSIADYFVRSQQRYVKGTWSIIEERPFVQFVINPGALPDAKFKGVLNPEFYATRAQYLAAGSFGPFHATTFAFDDANRKPFLDRSGFDVTAPGKCLWQLRPAGNAVADQKGPVAQAARLAVAHHAYSKSIASAYVCSQLPCDQIDFARKWSQIFSRYNPGAPLSYRINSFPTTRGFVVQDAGVNWIGDRSVRVYDVGLHP